MRPPTTVLPDDRKWIYPEIDGRRTGWANLPPSEILAIVHMVEYLTEQLAACNAVATPPTPAKPASSP